NQNRLNSVIADLVRERLRLLPQSPLYLSKFRTAGPHSRGFGLVYDTKEAAMACEPSYKLRKMGVAVAKQDSGKKKNKAAKKIA
ncbi:hypothetical protein KI387_027392, partial [Taxus chinensis]